MSAELDRKSQLAASHSSGISMAATPKLVDVISRAAIFCTLNDPIRLSSSVDEVNTSKPATLIQFSIFSLRVF